MKKHKFDLCVCFSRPWYKNEAYILPQWNFTFFSPSSYVFLSVLKRTTLQQMWQRGKLLFFYPSHEVFLFVHIKFPNGNSTKAQFSFCQSAAYKKKLFAQQQLFHCASTQRATGIINRRANSDICCVKSSRTSSLRRRDRTRSHLNFNRQLRLMLNLIYIPRYW